MDKTEQCIDVLEHLLGELNSISVLRDRVTIQDHILRNLLDLVRLGAKTHPHVRKCLPHWEAVYRRYQAAWVRGEPSELEDLKHDLL